MQSLRDIFNNANPIDKRNFPTGSLGEFVGKAINLTLSIAFFLAFIWMVWGIFQYIFAGGNKESLGKARGRITWALVGLAITMLAFAISQYAQTLLQVQPVNITPINIPTP